MSKLISIVIPCYQVEAYIDRCIDSLVHQTIGVENLELIFVDDASCDHTWEHLLEWEKRYPESIVIIQHEENKRQGGARNTGLQYASAPYIGFIDSDDWIELNMYEKLYQKAQEYETDVVGCYAKRVFGSYEKLSKTGRADQLFRYESDDDRREFMINGFFGGVPFKIYKRELIFNHDLWFPEKMLYEDNYWLEQLKLHVNSYYLIEEELYHYFVNYNSTILCKKSESHKDRLKIELMNLEAYRNLGIDQKYYREIEFKFLRLYYINTLHIMFSRCDDFKLVMLEEMQKTVKNNFSDYKNNPYLSMLNGIEKVLLQTLEVKFSQELIKQFVKEYNSVLQ